MPQAVAAAVATWFSGATVTTLSSAWAVSAATAAVYAAAYVTTTVVIAAGLGSLGRAMAPKLSVGALTGGSPLQMTRDPVAVRRVVYGETRMGGPMLYAQVSGSKNEYLHMVEAFAAHECEAIGNIYFADEVVPLDGSGIATGTYAGLARITKHLGSDSQTADSNLVSESGGLWTTDHRLRGIANIVARLSWDQAKFPGGIPNITAIVKGRKCYDPRDESTAWTANPALCILDYLTNTAFGLGADYDTEIDEASFISAANICDEGVDLAAGGTEKRYTVNGAFDLSAEPATVLEKLTSAMAGMVVYIGGKWICRAGAHETPTIELDENDLRGPISVQTKLSLRDTCNGVKGTFVSPDEKWQPTDFIPITGKVAAANLEAGRDYVISFIGTTDFTAIGAASNTVGLMFTATGPGTGTGYANQYLAEDGNIEIWRDIDLPFTTSHATAQRLAKIELERTRQDIVVQMPCKLSALRVQAGNVVMITNARFGWDQKLFLVTGLKFAAYDSAGSITLGIDLELRETAAAVWDWNSGEETTYDPAPNTNLPDPRTVAAPTSMALTVTSFRQPDGNLVPSLKISWAAPAEQFVQSGGLIRIQYKKHADSDWAEAAQVKGNQVFTFLLNLLIGTAYDVQIRAENNLGFPSAWVQVLNFTMTADTTPPAAPANLAAVVGTGKSVSLSWDAISKSVTPDFDDRYAVYRYTSNAPSSAVKIADISASRFVDVNVAIGTNYWYWVTAFDQSENESAKSTGVNATPVLVGTGSLDHTVPSDPTAATQTGSGVVQSTADGATEAYEQFSLPAMPAGAAGQNFLFKNHSDSQWLVVGQFTNTSTMTGLRKRGLVPGQQYDFATEAYNAFGDFSNVVATTGNPFTAPGDTTPPPGPGSFSFIAGDDATVRPPPVAPNGVLAYACTMNFAASTAKDVRLYQYILSPTGDQTGAITAMDAGGGVQIPGDITTANVYSATATGPLYVMIRAMDWSGNVTSPVIQSADMSSYLKRPAGNMIEQNKSNVDLTGGKAIMGGFEANQTTAVDIKAVNLRIYDSGGTQRARFNNANGDLLNNGNKVVGARMTGWSAPTGTSSRSTFDPATVTTEELAQRVKALLEDAGASAGHGLIDL